MSIMFSGHTHTNFVCVYFFLEKSLKNYKKNKNKNLNCNIVKKTKIKNLFFL